MIFSAEHKELIERQTLEAIATALEKNEMTEADIPPISKFVLEQIDKIQDIDQLIIFLQELSNKWPIFRGLFEVEKGKVREESEKIVAIEVSNLAQTGHLEEAINMAKSVTNLN